LRRPTQFISGGSLDRGRAATEEGWKREVANLSDFKMVTLERVIERPSDADRALTQQYHTPDGKTVAASGYFVALVVRDVNGQWRWQMVTHSRPA
jgi:hypothetical protein